MEAIASEQGEGLPWQAADWYRALSLTERLDPREAVAGSAPPDDSALSRLRAWEAQPPFDRESLFAERLTADSLSQHDLLSLLAEPAESLKARVPAVPEWLRALHDAFTGGDFDAELPPMRDEAVRDHPLAGCLPAVGPLLQRALRSLEADVQALRDRYEVVPVDAETLRAVFLTNITRALLFQVSKPVILEMHIARLQGRLAGETAEARFEHFMRQLSEPDEFVSLLIKYPVLARQLVLTIDQWRNYLHELLAHLCADWSEICNTFAEGVDPGALVELDAEKGDRHRKGRSVVLLRFRSGMRLLYKPRRLAVDVHFQELLAWLNDRGAEPPLRTLRIIDRGDYGWVEFVTASSCSSEEQVARFYERQGGLLALLYALDATDLHNENLIAAGEHPVLVDLEALFHPHIHGNDPILASNLAAGALDRSVWQVGILPRRVWSDEDSIGVDVSGLGGQPGQMNPHPLLGWSNEGSDEMRLGRRRVELPASENRPRLGERDVDAVDYRDSMTAGFTRMYRLLCEHREALLTEQLPRFANDEVRVVVRSTNVYGLLWYESFHPDLLRDALDRDRFFDRLWGEALHRPYLARVIPAERRDLLRGDIPAFTTYPASRDLVTSEGERFVDFFDTPSAELVRQRVEQLGEDDLRKQAWIIEAAIATLLMAREDSIARPAQRPPGRPVAREQLVALAGAVGERLDELALQDEAGAHWLGVVPLDDVAWGVVPTGVDLYSGTTGMALFLAYLGAVTGEPSHTRLANRALLSVQAQIRSGIDADGEKGDASLPLVTIGAFEGVASVVYLLTHLGVLWGRADLLDEAEELVGRLPPLIARDERLDVIYGSAGCILALLSLYAVRRSPRTLAVAAQCGERLLATAEPLPQGAAWKAFEDQPALGGFSHGAAGIALSLLRLAAETGEQRFRDSALSGLAYERSLLVREFHNWADLRIFASRTPDAGDPAVPAAEQAPKLMVAWCHGAPGIGLGRLAGLRELDDADVRQEIDIALRGTVEYGFAMNHSLCHGALGNVELLLTAARVLDRPEDHEALARATAEVAASIEANGPVSGVPLGVETPGFMTGLAGIGYELLRLAEPDNVPSALLVAPPRWQARG